MRGRRYFADAALIFACCALLAFVMCPGRIVEALLVLVIGTAALLALTGRALYAAELLLPAASLIPTAPEAVLFVPTALYISAANRHKLPALTGAALLIVSVLRNGGAAGFYEAAALSVIAAVLGLRFGELSRLSDELRKTRDNGAELEMALRSKNRELMTNQDNEVKLATLRERNRIAREIHDNVGHLLSRAILQSGALLAVTDKEKLPAQYAQTSALKETLGSAMNSIRESVHGLRDDSIDLRRAITEAADSVSGKFKVTSELDFSEDMPANVKLCFIAVVKEALSNAVKYSDGDRIKITVREHPALYQLSVSDNGKSAKIRDNGGMGLNNMRDRAEALGGIFSADASDGFRIFISVRRGENTGNENSSGR